MDEKEEKKWVDSKELEKPWIDATNVASALTIPISEKGELIFDLNYTIFKYGGKKFKPKVKEVNGEKIIVLEEEK